MHYPEGQAQSPEGPSHPDKDGVSSSHALAIHLQGGACGGCFCRWLSSPTRCALLISFFRSLLSGAPRDATRAPCKDQRRALSSINMQGKIGICIDRIKGK